MSRTRVSFTTTESAHTVELTAPPTQLMLPVPVRRQLTETNCQTLVAEQVMSVPNGRFPRRNIVFDTIKLYCRTRQKSAAAAAVSRLPPDHSSAARQQTSLQPTGDTSHPPSPLPPPPSPSQTAATHYQLGGLIGVTCLCPHRLAECSRPR